MLDENTDSSDYKPAVRSRAISRSNLATFLKSPELIKQFEDLTSDVATVLPVAVGETAQMVSDAAEVAILAMTAAAAAKSQADRLAGLVEELSLLARTQRTPNSEIARLQQRIEVMEMALLALQRGSNIDALRKQIDDLQTIVLGA